MEWGGKPVLVIGSAEHYGVLLDKGFDYRTYFAALEREGLNHSRVFSGAYREVSGDFKIENNTLSPAAGDYLAPWARSDQDGYAQGGKKFDLTQWDERYFERLHAVVSEAGKRGVFLEIVLFCFFYKQTWDASPMKLSNNVNGIGDVEGLAAYDLDNTGLQGVQEALTRKIVEGLRDYGNVYYEIINEPYVHFDGDGYQAWQRRIAEVIRETEAGYPRKHLIAQGVNNHEQMVIEPNPDVSILNFHYALPSSVWLNYHLNRLVTNDETGFQGHELFPYRAEAWMFFLAGGGLYSHLDYSFTRECPDGTAEIGEETPGSGGAEWRRQLRILRDFIKRFDFWEMVPAQEVLSLNHAERAAACEAVVFAEHGKTYALYLKGHRTEVPLGVPRGKLKIEWVSPLTGEILGAYEVDHAGGRLSAALPSYEGDIAGRIDYIS